MPLKKAGKISQPPPNGAVPGNDSWRNFAKLGEDFLRASRFIHEGFKSVPKWPTYQAAFQALENFLKAYLLLKGDTLDRVRELKLRDALSVAKVKGLTLKVDPAVEREVMNAAAYYTEGQKESGEWALVPPHLIISFADQVRRDARL